MFSFFGTRAAADILVPDDRFRSHSDPGLDSKSPQYYRHRFPWTNKTSSALFRGTPFCYEECTPFGDVCSRYLLAHLSTQLSHASRVLESVGLQGRAPPRLDVGLTEYAEEQDPYVAPLHTPEKDLFRDAVSMPFTSDLPWTPQRLRSVERVPIRDHPTARYLLHLDGITASTRLVQLLRTNSLVLKQSSFYFAYWHSAFRANAHFIPFWVDSPFDVFEILGNVSRPERDAEMKAVAERASELAYRLFSRPA
eukprot:5739291-Prymnesium_polylepis.1